MQVKPLSLRRWSIIISSLLLRWATAHTRLRRALLSGNLRELPYNYNPSNTVCALLIIATVNILFSPLFPIGQWDHYHIKLNLLSRNMSILSPSVKVTEQRGKLEMTDSIFILFFFYFLWIVSHLVATSGKQDWQLSVLLTEQNHHHHTSILSTSFAFCDF